MPVKVWHRWLVAFINVAIVVLSVYLLLPADRRYLKVPSFEASLLPGCPSKFLGYEASHNGTRTGTEDDNLRGDEYEGYLYQAHREAQLVLLIVSSISWYVAFQRVPKPQVFYYAVLSPVAMLAVTSDTVWKCPLAHFAYKTFGVMICLVLTITMRKLALRLDASTAIRRATVFYVAFTANAVLMLLFPRLVVLHVLEICIMAIVAQNGWSHYRAFNLASKEAMSVLASAPGLSLPAVKSARQAQINVNRNVKMCFGTINMVVLMGVLYSPFWPANISEGCHERCASDTPQSVEYLRFALADLFQVYVVVGVWHMIPTFQRRRRKNQSRPRGRRGGGGVIVAVPLQPQEERAPRTALETVQACCSPALLERGWHRKARSPYFHQARFVFGLSVVVVVAALLPLFITGEASFGAAQAVCRGRYAPEFTEWPDVSASSSDTELPTSSSAPETEFPIEEAWSRDVGWVPLEPDMEGSTASPTSMYPLPEGWLAILDSTSGMYYFYNFNTGETTWDRPRWLEPDTLPEEPDTTVSLSPTLMPTVIPTTVKVNEMTMDRVKGSGRSEEDAAYHLTSLHAFHTLASIVSLTGCVVWLYASPHQHSEDTAVLDRKLGSYCSFQVMANVLVTASSLHICRSESSGTLLLEWIHILSAGALSTVGSNFLSHRYMCEKACSMITILDTGTGDERHAALPRLEKLQKVCVWGTLSLYLFAVGALATFLFRPVGLMMGTLGCLCATVMLGTAFSTIVAVLFVVPAKAKGDGATTTATIVGQSQAYKYMQKAKWSTFLGSVLAAMSSTALYINAILYLAVGGQYRSSTWLNILVFGISLNSVLNDVAIALVSGGLRNLSVERGEQNVSDLFHSLPKSAVPCGTEELAGGDSLRGIHISSSAAISSEISSNGTNLSSFAKVSGESESAPESPATPTTVLPPLAARSMIPSTAPSLVTSAGVEGSTIRFSAGSQ